MMRSTAIALIVISFSVSSANAKSWPSTGGWDIHEADDFCIVSNSFEGKGETELIVGINLDGSALALITNTGWSAREGENYSISWVLNGSAYKGTGVGYGSAYASRKGFSTKFGPEFINDFAKATNLRILRAETLVDQLSLQGSAAAVSVARQCVAHVKALKAAELREQKRFSYIADDPFSMRRTDEEIAKYGDQPKPRGGGTSWVTNDDYPSRALREEREGIAGFQLTVSPEGAVTGCKITSSSGHADLDAETCSLISRRARFEPSSHGGTYDSRMVWRIPR